MLEYSEGKAFLATYILPTRRLYLDYLEMYLGINLGMNVDINPLRRTECAPVCNVLFSMKKAVLYVC